MRRVAFVMGTVGLVLILLAVAQLALPGIAAQRLRDRLSRSGRVLSVEVSAAPAIELLWHRADRVVIRMASYRSTPEHLKGLLDDASSAGTLDASVADFNTGLVRLHDARLRKRGDQLTGTATVTASDLRSAVPLVGNLHPVASGDGRLTLQGTVLGVTAEATLEAQNGSLVIQPDIPILNFLTLTVFEDPHLQIQGVGAIGAPGGFALSARARLR